MPKCDFSNFIEITLRHGCSSVNLLHIFKAPFPKNTSGGLLLKTCSQYHISIVPENIRKPNGFLMFKEVIETQLWQEMSSDRVKGSHTVD